MTTRNAILVEIHRSAGPQTTKQLHGVLRRDFPDLLEHQLGDILRQMQEMGMVKVEGGRWRALVPLPIVPAPPVVLPLPRTLNGKYNEPRRDATSTVVPMSATAAPPTGRWALFRHLCQYYIDCVLQDETFKLRGYGDRENDTWITIRQTIPFERLASGAGGCTINLMGDSKSFQRSRAKAGEDLCVLLGYPVQVVRPRAADPWIIPIFVQPMKADWNAESITLKPDGRMSINGAWLDSAFRTDRERRSFAEIVGLSHDSEEHADVEGDSGEAGTNNAAAPSFLQMVQQMVAYMHGHVTPGFRPGVLDLSTGWDNLEPGIVSRAVLMLGPRVTYTKSLLRELRKLVAWNDEELDRSSLSLLFPHEDADGSGPACPLAPCPTALPPDTPSFPRILNRPQRKAAIAALRCPASLITGPPGTGKSEVVRAIMLNQAIRARPTLFASKNHRALDAVVPPLNAMVQNGPLVIRTSTQDLAQRRTWRSTLSELLNRPESGTGARMVEVIDRLGDGMHRLNALLASWEHRLADRHAYGELNRQLEDAVSVMPLKLRGRTEIGRWPADVPPAQVEELRGRHARLSACPEGWVAALRDWFVRGRRLRDLESLELQFQCLPCDPTSNEMWPFKLWHLWAAARSLQQQVAVLELQLEAYEPAHSVLKEMSAAATRTGELVVEAADQIASGRGFMPSAETRGALHQLRAGIANLGERRFSRELAVHFPAILSGVPLWAVSNLSVGSAIPLVPGVFDLAIIDEASQCDIPSCLPIFARARRVVIVGDPRQLRHVTNMNANLERTLLQQHGLTDLSVQNLTYCQNSAFDLASSSVRLTDRVVLNEHYRCHPEMAELASDTFYDRALVVVTPTDNLRVPAGTRAGLHWSHVAGDIEMGQSGAICRAEIDFIVRQVKELERQPFAGTIGVVTPFRQQANRISDALEQAIGDDYRKRAMISVNTAHGFQGDERDLMFLSLACGEGSPPGALRFVAENGNLFNVAITRARAVLHVVGNREWAIESGISFIRQCAIRSQQTRAPDIESDPFESPWERVLAKALTDVGLEVTPQYKVANRRLDLAILEPVRVDVEVDGEAYHRTGSGARKDDDVWRDLQLKSLGWQVCRFWVYQLREDLPGCVAQVKHVIAGVTPDLR